MTLNKQQACDLLHISESTLQRRLKAGVYRCTRRGDGQFSPITFSYEQLGLQEPTPEPTPITSTAVEPTPDIGEPDAFAPRPLSKEERDAEFAAAYKAGTATDSIGNTADGINARFPSKGTQSLIGAVEPDHGPPAETQSHMDAALRHGDEGQPIPQGMVMTASGLRWSFEVGEGHTGDGSPLARGVTQEQYDGMMKAYRKHNGNRPSMSQQMAQIIAAQKNINDSFPKG